jgi:hypothetical protein
MAHRSALVPVCATLILGVGARADPDPLPGPFEFSLDAEAGIPRGYVQVRESDRLGTRLALHGDLGIDTVEKVTLGAAYHFDPSNGLRLDFDSIFLYGSKRLSSDVLYNGALLQRGTTVESRPEFFRITGLYERGLLDLPGGGHLAGDLGLSYVLLDFKLHATLSPQTEGHETKEDFLTQELPVPMLGLTLEQPISKQFSFVGTALGGYLPKVDSGRNEGGSVKLSQRHADVSARLRYHVTPNLDIEGGYAFHYYSQFETSREDGNDVVLWDHDLTVGFVYRF